MEPGHGDREDLELVALRALTQSPLWSPVTETGKTRGAAGGLPDAGCAAAMEPGHGDREDIGSMAMH